MIICVERGGSEDQEVTLGKHRAQERLGRKKVLYTGRTGNPGAGSGGRRFESCSESETSLVSCASFFRFPRKLLQSSPSFLHPSSTHPPIILEIRFMFFQSLHLGRSAPGQMFPKHWEVERLV